MPTPSTDADKKQFQPLTESTTAKNPVTGDPFEYIPSNYRKPKLLGEGADGKVYKLTPRIKKTAKEMVVKVIKNPAAAGKKIAKEENLEWEATVNANLGKIVYLYESEDKKNCYLFMEYAGDDLLKLSNNFKNKPKNKSALFLTQLFMRMAGQIYQMHEPHEGYIGHAHFDVKPENMGAQSNAHHIRLFDFACSEPIGDQLRYGKGTPDLMAPETLSTNEKTIIIDGKIDVFSLGVVYLEMMLKILLGKKVQNFYGNGRSKETILKIRQHEPLEYTPPLLEIMEFLKSKNLKSDELEHYMQLIAIIEKMLNKNPKKRSTSKEVYSDLAKLRYTREIANTKNDKNKLQELEEHVIRKEKGKDTQQFKKDLKIQCFEDAKKFNRDKTNTSSIKEQFEEKRKLYKCRNLVLEAKKRWEKEQLKINKNILKAQRREEEQLKINKNSTPEKNTAKCYTPTKSTLKELEILDNKIKAANELLNPELDLKTFKAKFCEKQQLKTLSADRSSLIKRILTAIIEILIPPLAIGHSIKKGTLFYRSHGKALENKLSSQLGKPDKIPTR